MKKLDLSKSVYELTQEYPELIEMMVGLGFPEIAKAPVRNSVGKIMTIPRGAKVKNISMIDIVTALQAKGFTLVGQMPGAKPEAQEGPDVKSEQRAESTAQQERSVQPAPDTQSEQTASSAFRTTPSAKSAARQAQPAADASAERIAQLKSYLKRLGAGEDLESVRADFVRKFSDVDASEIMRAEQELMREGTPLPEVQKLCDIHSALFHGATREEQIANAEKEVRASLLRKRAREVQASQEVRAGQGTEASAKASKAPETQGAQAASIETAASTVPGVQTAPAAQRAQAAEQEQKARPGRPASAAHVTGPQDRKNKAAGMEAIAGHPLCTLKKENDVLAARIAEFRKTGDASLIGQIREIAIHYAKKGDLLYPLLNVRYGVTGPAKVMWTVDDEIRDALRDLASAKEHDAEWNQKVEAALTRAEEMIYKEQNILFPICAEYFSAEEWHQIYRDSKDYAVCLGVAPEVWEEAEQNGAPLSAAAEGEVVMPGGHMTVPQLTALLNTIPMEISFVDADNINRFFNEGHKVFKRPGAAIDREVFSCHPPKVEPMVRQIMDDFRNNRRDDVSVWMEKEGRTMLVRYMAVRDREGHYLGTAEVVQDMEFAKEHFANA